jgi:hypothetical protein
LTAKAHAARTLTLNEVGHLRLRSHHGFTLNEQGSASGAIAGTIYVHLNVVSASRITAEVNIYPTGGSLTGHASASYQVKGAYASFLGTMSIARGTGRYAHARAGGLRFAGAIKRIDDAVTVEVSGKLLY